MTTTHLWISKVPHKKFWFMFEQVGDEMEEVAFFTSGKRAARFCNLVKIMGSSKKGDEVILHMHLPETLIDEIKTKAKKAKDD